MLLLAVLLGGAVAIAEAISRRYYLKRMRRCPPPAYDSRDWQRQFRRFQDSDRRL
jgi:hypothetical protein